MRRFNLLQFGRSSRRRHAGTAMTEMVLVAPLLLFVLAWLIYFGRGMTRAQHVAVTDRYETWRQVARAPGPRLHDAGYHQQLNETFFAGNARSLSHDTSHGFPYDAPEDLERAGFDRNYDTGQLIESSFDAFETGRTVRIRVRHYESVQAYQSFDGPIQHQHTRIGHDWKYVNAWDNTSRPAWTYGGSGPSMYPLVRDVYYQRLDDQLRALDDRDNQLARMVRNLYLTKVPYRGPEVRF
jgi:hypothetical protein